MVSTLFGNRAAKRDIAAALQGSTPLQAALNSLNANCFIADLGLNLVWMNRKAAGTLDELAPAINAAFGLPIEELLNGSIHRFHADPGRIDRILADPTALPRIAVFEFGGVTLRTRINAITDDRGVRHGYIVVWDNVSARNREAGTAFTELGEAANTVSSTWEDVELQMGQAADLATSTATATTELRGAVNEIARSSATTADMVRETVKVTEMGTERLAELQEFANEIGRILELVTSVSDQTRMLALNATIEAARAGAAGKGFAVVANEVKQLASATADSITDIEQRISSMRLAAEASVSALADIAERVSQLEESNESVAAAIEEQSVVTDSIAQAMEGIAESTEQTVQQSAGFGQAVAGISQNAERLRDVITSS